MNKRTIKMTGRTRTVFENDKPDFARSRSDMYAVPKVNNAINQAKPLESVGMACHRQQVTEFNEMYRDKGISGAYHKKDGTLVLESRQARNDVLKARGCRDNDAGYGDFGGDNTADHDGEHN